MDEEALQKQYNRGQRAQRILDDELVQATLAKIEEDIINQWQETKAGEDDKREQNYYLLRALKEFRHRFETMVKTGDNAGKKLGLFRKR